MKSEQGTYPKPSDLPTVYLLTKDCKAFTVPFQGDPNKPCVLIFRNKEVAAQAKQMCAPLANENTPVDLGEAAVDFLRRLWQWDVDYWLVVESMDLDAPVVAGKLAELFVQ
jgi:hypothetical protein